jgi:hypothetical protein
MGGRSIDLDMEIPASDSSLYKRIQDWNAPQYSEKIEMEEYSILIVENPFREIFSFSFDPSHGVLHVIHKDGWFVDLQIRLIYHDLEYPIVVGNSMFMSEKKINVNLSLTGIE